MKDCFEAGLHVLDQLDHEKQCVKFSIPQSFQYYNTVYSINTVMNACIRISRFPRLIDT